MNDRLALAIEWALEMAESFEAAARNPDRKPMAKPLRDAVWIRLDGELQAAGLDMETALRAYAEKRRQMSSEALRPAEVSPTTDAEGRPITSEED